jgi:enoyl-CoA hydratase/carnithine racemase
MPYEWDDRSVTAPAPNYTTINWQVEDRILTLTLNRPEHLNSFTPTMADELENAFRRAQDDDSVAAIVVTGAGRAFCAGMDLTAAGNVFGLDESQHPTLDDLVERYDDPTIVEGVRDTGGRVTLAIYACTKPVLAAINGPAVGIGATMTCAMDVRLASDRARIGFVFGKIGIVPEACSTWFLPRLVGMSQALEWLYTADILTAEDARIGGLVRSVHPTQELLPAAYALAHRFIDDRSAVSTALIRQMIQRNSAQDDPVQAHLIESLAVFYTSQRDGKEGVQAFLDKRAPRFSAQASTDMPPFYPWW